MKKTIAAYIKPDGEWLEQQEITLGPLEEAAILADWACGNHAQIEPKKMTLTQKVDALANPLEGATKIATMEAAYQTQYTGWKKTCDSLEADRQAKWQAYNSAIINKPAGTKTC